MDSNSGIIIARLHISYDRGVRRNSPEDVGLDSQPVVTPDGDIVRGLGTKISAADKEIIDARNRENQRLMREFQRAFVAAPFDGTYIIPERGAARRLLDSLDPPVRADVKATVSEYVLGIVAQAPAEVQEWSKRVQNQMARIPLGRSENVAAEGLDVLAALAQCPVLAESTRESLSALIADARLEKVTRVDFQRKLAKLSVDLSTVSVAPRKPKRSPITKS